MASLGDKVDYAIYRAAVDQEERLDFEIEQQQKQNEDTDGLIDMRRKRLEAMKGEHKQRNELSVSGHGNYDEVYDEKEFFALSKKCKKMVIHFYRPATFRCEVVDKHFPILARRHYQTRFVKVNAEKCQYLSEKLHIWMLPSIVLINEGKTEHTIVGLDEMGGEDTTTERIEEVLAYWKMIEGEA